MVFHPGDGGNVLDTGRRSGEEGGRRQGEGGAPEPEGVASRQPAIYPATSVERLLYEPWNGPCRLHTGALRCGQTCKARLQPVKPGASTHQEALESRAALLIFSRRTS